MILHAEAYLTNNSNWFSQRSVSKVYFHATFNYLQFLGNNKRNNKIHGKIINKEYSTISSASWSQRLHNFRENKTSWEMGITVETL